MKFMLWRTCWKHYGVSRWSQCNGGGHVYTFSFGYRRLEVVVTWRFRVATSHLCVIPGAVGSGDPRVWRGFLGGVYFRLGRCLIWVG